MILAVGLDVVDVPGFAEQLADAASGFAAATFTPAERAGAGTPPERAARHLAGRFAAKEAFVKAWSGARRGRPAQLPALDLRDIEVVLDRAGRPALVLHGPVAAALAELGGPGRGVGVHLSLSHDGPVAAAVVVLDGPEPDGPAPGGDR